jgi:hypothetical protein
VNQDEIRAYNMDYLRLTSEQYDEHQRLWVMKMSEWPPALWRYVYRYQRKYMLCGEVVIAAIADWVRGEEEEFVEQPQEV